MSKELPHASLQCSCGTVFRVTLKKGRAPSRPIPCPTCKSPITVTEDDIEHPDDERRTRSKTTPGDVLRKTRLAQIDEDGIAALMDDPATAEVPEADPPTAEVELDDEEIAAAMELSDAPAFGIIQKRKIGPKSSDPQLRKETPLGVDVARASASGRGRRDNVFGRRASNAVAIGRISARAPEPINKKLNPEDPDLPVVDEEQAPADEAPPKKLDLSRLRRVMAKLDAETAERQPEEESYETPLENFDLDIDDDVEDLINEASDAVEAELNLISEVSEAEDAEEPELAASSSAGEDAGEPEVAADDDSDLEESFDEPFPDSGESFRDPLESELKLGTLEVEESDAYELGDALVPDGAPEKPRNRGSLGGIVVGVVMLLVLAVIFIMMAT